MKEEREGAPEAGVRRVLLTGATGYVGGRLLAALEQTQHRVRCMARRPEFLASRVGPDTEVVYGDCFDSMSLAVALHGMDVAYYLVHSMGSSGDFESEDRIAAKNFSEAAKRAGVKRIIYLGGLGESCSDLSQHLRSRHETGEVLRESGVETVEFRASIIIGSGSLSFELIRSLVERLPVMICPRWVDTPAQPCAIEDVIRYLAAGMELTAGDHRTFEIGGPDVVSYGDIMREYARQRGLRRLMIPVPVLTPRLSSLWLGLVTPLYARVGRKLVDSLRHQTVVSNDDARRVFPIEPLGVGASIQRSLHNEDSELAATRWSDAVSASGETKTWAGIRFGTRLVDSRTAVVKAGPAAAFAPIRRIGGKTGWYYGDWLWQLRGFIDLAVGGVGMRRTRPDPEEPQVGDVLDCWRVEAVVPDRTLRLSAEMLLPGRAWLEFEVEGEGDHSVVRQTAIYDPRGLLGLAYWYGIYPLHGFVFAGMIAGIARAAEDPEREKHRVPATWPALVVFLLGCLGLGALGGSFADVGWYEGLSKPAGSPTPGALGAIWVILHLAMALGGWLVWNRRQTSVWAVTALKLFAVQLALNTIWPIVVFGLRSPAAGLFEIVFLWGFSGLATLAAWRVRRAAALLLAPYFVWVSFALGFTFQLWWLND